MPRRPTVEELAARLAELETRAKATDDLAVHTAKRLDRHMTSSGDVHRWLRARIKELFALWKSTERPQDPTS